MTVHLSTATPNMAAGLTALTIRSKLHWGYDAAFIETFRDELTVTEEAIRNDRVTVLRERQRVGGYAHLRREDDETVELVSLFIDPWAIRRGFGTILWRDAIDWARGAGFRRLVIESDPHAEGFYRSLGAEEEARRESAVMPGRYLAVMAFFLTTPPS